MHEVAGFALVSGWTSVAVADGGRWAGEARQAGAPRQRGRYFAIVERVKVCAVGGTQPMLRGLRSR